MQECVEELDKELTKEADVDDGSDDRDGSSQAKAQTWLEKLQENMHMSASRVSKGTAEGIRAMSPLSFCRLRFVHDCVVLLLLPGAEEAGPSRVCAVPSIFNMTMKLEVPGWLASLSPTSACTQQVVELFDSSE